MGGVGVGCVGSGATGGVISLLVGLSFVGLLGFMMLVGCWLLVVGFFVGLKKCLDGEKDGFVEVASHRVIAEKLDVESG